MDKTFVGKISQIRKKPRKTPHSGTLSIIDWPPQSLVHNIIDAVLDHVDKDWNKG